MAMRRPGFAGLRTFLCLLVVAAVRAAPLDWKPRVLRAIAKLPVAFAGSGVNTTGSRSGIGARILMNASSAGCQRAAAQANTSANASANATTNASQPREPWGESGNCGENTLELARSLETECAQVHQKYFSYLCQCLRTTVFFSATCVDEEGWTDADVGDGRGTCADMASNPVWCTNHGTYSVEAKRACQASCPNSDCRKKELSVGEGRLRIPSHAFKRKMTPGDCEAQLCKAIVLGQDFIGDHYRCLHPWSTKQTIGQICPRPS